MTTSRRDTLTTPVRTQADLESLWRTLMEPLGFARGSLWLMRIGADDLPTPGLAQIEDDDDGAPTPDQMPALADLLRRISDDDADGVRWAFLRSRPGRGGVTDVDRALARGLLAACRVRGVPTDVLHLATDDQLVALPYDELAVSA